MGKKSNNNLNRLIKEFEEYLLIAGRSKNTIDAYTRTIKQTLSSRNLDTLSQHDLNKIALKLIKHYQVNANRMRYAAINLFCKKILHRNDLYLKILKPKRRNRDVLTYEQVKGLLKVAKGKRKVVNAFIQVLFRCALRKGELCNLNVEDVNFQTMEIYLRDTKTGDGVVVLDKVSAEAIKDYLEHERIPINKGEKALFLSKRGKRIGERFVRDNLKQCAVEAGITRRVYPHMLRASSITHMLNVGTNPLTVQTQARYNSFKQTMTYNRPTQQQMREAIEKAFNDKNETTEEKPNKNLNTKHEMTPDDIQLILLEKYASGEITLEKYDKLMEVMRPKQLKPVTELAGYI